MPVSPGVQAGVAALTSGHNGGLVAAATQLGAAIPSATFAILPYSEILTAIITNATKYGFSAPSWQQCYGTVADPIGTDGHQECTDPSQHVFWDSVQPSSAAAAVVAATVAQAVATSFPDIKATVPKNVPSVADVPGLILPNALPAGLSMPHVEGPSAGPPAYAPSGSSQAGEAHLAPQSTDEVIANCDASGFWCCHLTE